MHVHTPIKVRYGETDMMGVVYHANYLLYFEDARIDFLNALDFSYAERIEGAGYMSPIHDVEIHYRAPLRYGEEGFVRTSVAKNLPMRTVYRQQVYRAEDVVEDAAADKASDAPDGPGTEGTAAPARREPLLREGATPLVDALITVCVVERDTFKPVSLKRTFPDLYAAYADIAEEA
ncbi:thioesterase family protein [Adlercreutzia sp. R7]|uniref:Thioesterase family protein n=1 Tax=Adlercreutzia wanghongyangiae TaxID=3111451 RepID=A0ABU6IJD9_9ACTN|nr:thioesterase family protein [Adlercreutzia sp. R7]